MLLNQVAEYLWSTVDVALVLFFVSRFLPKIKASKTIIFILVMAQSVVNNVTGQALGAGSLLALVVMLTTTGLFYKIIFEEGILTIYAYILFALIASFLSEGVAVLACMLCGILPNDMHSNVAAKMVGYSISKGLYFLLILYFIPKLKLFRQINKTKVYQILLVCMFNIIIIFMAFWFYKNTGSSILKEHAIQYILMTTLGAILFSIGIVGLLRGIVHQSQREAEWLVKETEYKRQMFYVDSMQDMLKSIKAQRHDFNNHIACLYGLIKMNNRAEAQQYMERLAEEASQYNNVIDAGHPILSALLNNKMISAQRNKVQLHTRVNLPEEIKIEPIDLSIILGNLLDNGLEACAAVAPGDRNIDLDIYINNNRIIIKMVNAKSPALQTDMNSQGAGYTSKEDAGNHGFGLSNIKNAVNKYGGIVKFEDKGSSFISNIAIPMKA
jgi:two-component system sensor histidine kinase AgrC